MTLVTHRFVSHRLALILAATALTFTGCTSNGGSDDAPAESQVSAVPETVEIPSDTPVGNESKRILDILNAEEDTTAQDWKNSLHETFTAEVSVDELVEVLNQNIRPAQPFEAVNYEGDEQQAVTTLTSAASDSLAMTVSLDSEGRIDGLFFTQG